MAKLGRFVRELAARRREIRARRKRIKALKRGSERTRLIRAQRAARARTAKVRAAIIRLRHPALNVTVAFDGTPVFRGHALMFQDVRDQGRWKGSLTAGDRRNGVAERYGKMSQLALYVAYWVKHLPGFNPANRPGQSTHELRSDATAYLGPVGRPLAWWQLGIDATDADTLRAELVRLGYPAFRPYSAGSEVQHTNLRSNPKSVLRKRGRA